MTARERQPTPVEDRREARVQRFGSLAEWPPENLARFQWLGETLELQAPQLLDFVASPTAGKEHHQFGTANRGRICRRFQPLGLDDGQSEAVVSFERHIADGDADANLQRLTGATPIRQIDRLLDRDGCSQRSRRTREGGHQTIAEMFDDVSAIRTDHLIEQQIVATPERLGHVLTELRSQRG